jgi:hypothetical protein
LDWTDTVSIWSYAPLTDVYAEALSPPGVSIACPDSPSIITTVIQIT